MYFPQIEDNYNNRNLIDTWYGYDHRYRIQNGYLYDMENLTLDNFPLMTPRQRRPVLVDTGDDVIRGMIYTDGVLAYLVGNTLYYSTKAISLEGLLEGEEEQTLLRMGAYIVMFPSGVYVNIFDEDDKATIDYKISAPVGVEIKYSICDSEGRGYDKITVSEEAPSEPSNNSYWLCTAEGSQGLYVWYKSKSYWTPVATSYIRIEIPDTDLSKFYVGDCITMNTQFNDINSNSQIRAKGDDYIVVVGFMPGVIRTEKTTRAWTLTLHRVMPQLDYVCTDKNRIWGCRYGYQNGQMVNEIYASKLGDFRNWYCYQALSTDSYAVGVGVPGEWTGCISYQGYPTFFKENAIIKVYGSFPSEYQTLQSDVRGVQQGSHKSLAIVDEMLIYKSTTDVCVYDGSSPVGISDNFGKNVMYYDAIGGGCLHKYRCIMENPYGTKYHFVYDLTTGLWTKEDALNISTFSTSENGQMYGCDETKIYGFGSSDNVIYTNPLPKEEWVYWYAETGQMGYEYPDYKYVSKLTVRAFLEVRSEIQILISYDDAKYEEVGTMRGDGTGSQALDIFPYRCDHYQLKFVGHGDVRIYSVAITLDTGSEDESNI